jgi:hypothetical protein
VDHLPVRLQMKHCCQSLARKGKDFSCFQFIGFIREDSRNSRQKDFAFLKSARLLKKY